MMTAVGHQSHVDCVQQRLKKEGNNHALLYACGCYGHSIDLALSIRH